MDGRFLGKEKISKLLYSLSLPSTIGLLVISLYNLVDTIFIGQAVGPLGIAALSIVFPLQMIMNSIAQLFGVGASSLISRAMGEKKLDKVRIAIGNFFVMSILSSLVLAIIGFIFMDKLLLLVGATEEILPLAREYFQIIIFGSILFAITAGGNNLIRAVGKAKVSMWTMIIAAGINIVLDPIFIFLFGWGIRGAAIATVVSQAAAAIYVIYFFMSRHYDLLHLKYFKLSYSTIAETVKVGVSSFARQVSMSVGSIILNIILALTLGEIAIAGFGIINRVMMVVIIPIFGVVLGLQPIVGYNYGAKLFSRVKEALGLAVKSATIIGTTMFLVLIIFTRAVVSIFTSDQALIDFTVPAMRIVVIAFPLIGFQIIAGGFYQSVGYARKAFTFSLLRSVILFIPLLFIIPRLLGPNLISLVYPVSDVIAFAITYFVYHRDVKRMIERQE